MMCSFDLGFDALSYVDTDVAVLVASIVMVVESTRLRVREVLNLYPNHFEKPKSRNFFSKMYEAVNNPVRFSFHLPWCSRQQDLIIWNFGVRLSDCTGPQPTTDSLHKLLFLLEIQLFLNVCAVSTGQEFAGLRRAAVPLSSGPCTPRGLFSWGGHKMQFCMFSHYTYKLKDYDRQRWCYTGWFFQY